EAPQLGDVGVLALADRDRRGHGQLLHGVLLSPQRSLACLRRLSRTTSLELRPHRHIGRIPPLSRPDPLPRRRDALVPQSRLSCPAAPVLRPRGMPAASASAASTSASI